MDKNARVAITQMNVAPDALENRLKRAEILVQKSVKQGAQLVVLPELFNTGYRYTEENFSAASMYHQLTERWMKEISRKFKIYLAGSFFYYDQQKIFNSLLFQAPNGKTWRYYKNCPWGWERAYFQAGDDIQIAETELGRIGFMLCWDVAHADLWRKYAGKVDLIISCTCPPDIPDANYYFAGNKKYHANELGPLFTKIQQSANKIFVETPAQQCQWLGVPYISSTGSGKINTGIPNPRGSYAGVLFSKPELIRYFSEVDEVKIEADMVESGRIFGIDGQQLGQLKNNYNDDFLVAEVEYNDNNKPPVIAQPKPPVSGLVYFVSDWLLTAISRGTYQRGLRKINRL